MLTYLVRVEQAVQRLSPEAVTGRAAPYAYACVPALPCKEVEFLPVFQVASVEAAQLYLEAGLDRLDVVNRLLDGLPLLHCCINKDLISECIVSRLREQVDLNWMGVTAIDLGKQCYLPQKEVWNGLLYFSVSSLYARSMGIIQHTSQAQYKSKQVCS